MKVKVKAEYALMLQQSWAACAESPVLYCDRREHVCGIYPGPSHTDDARVSLLVVLFCSALMIHQIGVVSKVLLY